MEVVPMEETPPPPITDKVGVNPNLSSTIATNILEATPRPATAPVIPKPNHASPGTGKLSWAQILRSSNPKHLNSISSSTLSRIQLSSPSKVSFSANQLQQWQSPWHASLIGNFFGKLPPLPVVSHWASNLWSSVDLINVLDIEDDFFVFAFLRWNRLLTSSPADPGCAGGMSLDWYPGSLFFGLGWKHSLVPLFGFGFMLYRWNFGILLLNLDLDYASKGHPLPPREAANLIPIDKGSEEPIFGPCIQVTRKKNRPKPPPQNFKSYQSETSPIDPKEQQPKEPFNQGINLARPNNIRKETPKVTQKFTLKETRSKPPPAKKNAKTGSLTSLVKGSQTAKNPPDHSKEKNKSETINHRASIQKSFDQLVQEETDVSVKIANSFIRKLGKDWKGVSSPSNGASGGIILAWNINFVNAKVDYPESKNIVHQAWNKPIDTLNPSPSFLCNSRPPDMPYLSGIKLENLEANLKITQGLINNLEIKEASNDLSPHEQDNLTSLINKATIIQRQISLKWWANAKLKWYLGGDRNTAYFHRMVTFERKINHISSITSDSGDTISGDREILTEFSRFYPNLWNHSSNPFTIQLWPHFPFVFDNFNNFLTAPFYKTKI
ncbi:hypothetical protein Cni_G29423 [Canna indica]|uniref:Uncharacterized protein n=1 Tax=Canna indica TaxID=4628 RepID=A0AAQ3L8B3_9LILI|nr:hypothetical protein Cni_G29423 [Canna indica]